MQCRKEKRPRDPKIETRQRFKFHLFPAARTERPDDSARLRRRFGSFLLAVVPFGRGVENYGINGAHCVICRNAKARVSIHSHAQSRGKMEPERGQNGSRTRRTSGGGEERGA